MVQKIQSLQIQLGGMPTNNLLPESSHGSTISYKWGETYEMKKIRNFHVWHAMPYKERSL